MICEAFQTVPSVAMMQDLSLCNRIMTMRYYDRLARDYEDGQKLKVTELDFLTEMEAMADVKPKEWSGGELRGMLASATA